MTVRIDVKVLEGLTRYLAVFPEKVAEAARIAINDVADRQGRKLLVQDITQQVAFPAGYVNRERLFFKKRARNDDLEAIIEGRQRPTSLARFASGAAIGQKGAKIRVRVANRGGGRTLNNAFLVRLNAGRGRSEDRFNVGLALRVKEGKTLHGRKKGDAKPIFPGVYLLYGPSVDQVFQGVAADRADDILGLVETQFRRQFLRLTEFG